MLEALKEAEKAYRIGEVPVGAVLVKDGHIIARAYNQVESLKDPTAHAEILAIREGTRILESWRLEACDLYVSLEPCAMCAGALVQARINKVFFGVRDSRKGCCGTVHNLLDDENFNHRAEVIYKENIQARNLLSSFFKELRERKF